MQVHRIAAFSDGNVGGNPAGVVLDHVFPTDAAMQRVAAEVGYSETAFAVQQGDVWRVRYFSPESEVPFCGHATIALGAALVRNHGQGVFTLQLNLGKISVEGHQEGNLIKAALQSPLTRSTSASHELVANALNLFGYVQGDLDARIPPAIAHAGADHLILALNTRAALAAMKYDLAAGRVFMRDAGLITVVFAFAETSNLFHTRNPFAAGGVYEDPATGAGTAALAGYLRSIQWPHGGQIEIIQGADMGIRSRLTAEIPAAFGASIRVSGFARFL